MLLVIVQLILVLFSYYLKFTDMKIFIIKSTVAVTAAVALFSFTHLNTGSIKGSVTPADAGTKVWALSITDTLKAQIKSGSFEITNARAGTYRLIVEAKPPYKNTAKDNITVADGAPTNVGEIKLSQ